jgi:hypothetical protein
VASPNGSGILDTTTRIGIEKDAPGLHSGAAMMNRALELAAILKHGADDKRA